MTQGNLAETQAGTATTGGHLLPVYAHLGLEPVRGEGVKLFTRDGREYLDFYGGHAVASLGYGHPRLLAALRSQAEALFFQSNAVPVAVRERAARALVRFAGDAFAYAFFVNSGAEANENALRIALRHTGRSRIVAVEGAFHGRTAASGAVTWRAAQSWYAFPRTPFEVTFVPRGDAGALEEALGDDVGAMIVEPVQGVAGAVDLGRAYLDASRTLTQAVGALLVFDEVQCGMGRTGHPFAADLYGVTPDVLTTAKGIAGGFPAGAVLIGEELAGGLDQGSLGTTFGGGPLACALIETVVATITEDHLLERVRTLSGRIRSTCRLGPVVGMQGEGFLLGLRTSRPAKEIQAELLDRGILAGTSADPDVLRLLPPLVLEEEHVDALAAALRELAP